MLSYYTLLSVCCRVRIISCDPPIVLTTVNIFNYCPVGDVTRHMFRLNEKAPDDIFDYRPVTCHVTPTVSGASMHNGYSLAFVG